MRRIALVVVGLLCSSLAASQPFNPPVIPIFTTDVSAATFAGFTLVSGRADGVVAADGVMGSGSANLTSASKSCNSASDPGKIVEVAAAGATVLGVQQPLSTTIASCSGATFVLAATASNAVTSAFFAYGTDYSSVLRTGIAANKRNRVTIPPGIVMLRSTSIPLNNINISCTEAPNINNSVAGYAQYGTAFVIASTSLLPFVVEQGTAINGCNFFWPGQQGINTDPVIYQPLLTDNAGFGQSAWIDFVFDNNTVVNAYDFLTQSLTGGMHNVRIMNSNIYAVRRVFSLHQIGETVALVNLVSNTSIFSPAPANLVAYTRANGEWIYAYGSGTDGGACETDVIGGFQGLNLTVENYRYGLHVVSGYVDESTLNFGSMGGVGSPVAVEVGGKITRTNIDMKYYSTIVEGGADNATAFSVQTTCTGGGSQQNDLTISGQVVSANGTLIDIGGTYETEVTVSNLKALHWGQSSTGGTYYALKVNNASARVNITNNWFLAKNNAGTGILVQSAASVNIIGNVFDNVRSPIDTNGAGTTPIAIIGNTTLNTRTTNSVVNLAAGVKIWDNSFDVPPQGGGDLGGVAVQLVDNGDFEIDQLHEGASASNPSRVVDRWQWATSAGAAMATQRITQNPPSVFAGHSYHLLITNGSAVNPTAAQATSLQQKIETIRLDGLNWANDAALPLMLDYCAQASVSGTYTFYIKNAGSSWSILLPFTLSSGVSKCGSIPVPGPSSSTSGWSATVGASFLIGIDLGSGSNFQATTSGDWESGNFTTLSSAVVFSNHAAATLKLAGIRLRTVYEPSYHKPSYPEELARAQRCYLKSFAQGTVPAQNAGATGAITWLAPYAQATFANSGIPIAFPVRMFATSPTITFYSTSKATANVYDSTQANDIGAASAVNTSDTGFMLNAALAGAVNAALGDQLQVHYTADAGC